MQQALAALSALGGRSAALILTRRALSPNQAARILVGGLDTGIPAKPPGVPHTPGQAAALARLLRSGLAAPAPGICSLPFL